MCSPSDERRARRHGRASPKAITEQEREWERGPIDGEPPPLPPPPSAGDWQRFVVDGLWDGRLHESSVYALRAYANNSGLDLREEEKPPPASPTRWIFERLASYGVLTTRALESFDRGNRGVDRGGDS